MTTAVLEVEVAEPVLVLLVDRVVVWSGLEGVVTAVDEFPELGVTTAPEADEATVGVATVRVATAGVVTAEVVTELEVLLWASGLTVGLTLAELLELEVLSSVFPLAIVKGNEYWKVSGSSSSSIFRP